jgi:hypothetical protein
MDRLGNRSHYHHKLGKGGDCAPALRPMGDVEFWLSALPSEFLDQYQGVSEAELLRLQARRCHAFVESVVMWVSSINDGQKLSMTKEASEWIRLAMEVSKRMELLLKSATDLGFNMATVVGAQDDTFDSNDDRYDLAIKDALSTKNGAT